MHDPDIDRFEQDAAHPDERTIEALLPLVYDELRRIAAVRLSRERPDHTLQPTALVHEVYLKLAGQSNLGIRDRNHFLALASSVMRHVLVDHARTRGRDKRGGEYIRVLIDEIADSLVVPQEELLQVHEALTALARLDPHQAKIVELKYFTGFDIAEIAEILGVSASTVKREWATAKLWLKREISRNPAAP